MLQNQWPVGLHWQDLSTLNVSRKKLDLNITEETLHCSGARRSLQSSVSQSVYDSMMYHCLCLAFLLLRSGQSSKTLDKSLKYIQEKRLSEPKILILRLMVVLIFVNGMALVTTNRLTNN